MALDSYVETGSSLDLDVTQSSSISLDFPAFY
jgi:hypothetical protein